jgi:hypothetical protein
LWNDGGMVKDETDDPTGLMIVNPLERLARLIRAREHDGGLNRAMGGIALSEPRKSLLRFALGLDALPRRHQGHDFPNTEGAGAQGLRQQVAA